MPLRRGSETSDFSRSASCTCILSTYTCFRSAISQSRRMSRLRSSPRKPSHRATMSRPAAASRLRRPFRHPNRPRHPRPLQLRALTRTHAVSEPLLRRPLNNGSSLLPCPRRHHHRRQQTPATMLFGGSHRPSSRQAQVQAPVPLPLLPGSALLPTQPLRRRPPLRLHLPPPRLRPPPIRPLPPPPKSGTSFTTKPPPVTTTTTRPRA